MASEQHERLVREVHPQMAPAPGASIEDMRLNYEAVLRRAPVRPDAQTTPVTAGSVGAEWTQIHGLAPLTIFYLHGGGYAIGSAAGYREFAARLAGATRARVLCVDYRLAPEHPFPDGLDDAFSAYKWLLAEGQDPRRLVIGGDSAGGGLAMGLLMRLRDEGLPLPAAAFFLSPFLDLRGSGESVATKAAIDPIGKPESIHGMAAMYAAQDLDHPYASPIMGRYDGLPPLFFAVGTRETLLDDSVRAVARALSAKAEVELVIEEDLTHIWPVLGPDLPESERTLGQIATFLGQHAAA
jgi:monoterpene epsilon-lactone hydrolase